MGRLKLAICDEDEIYCRRLNEYLHDNLKLNFDICSFTDLSLLTEYARQKTVSLLMIAESAFYELESSMDKALFKNVMVLDEENIGCGMVRDENPEDSRIEYISKFQPAMRIIDGIVDFCTAYPQDFGEIATRAVTGVGKIIGFYTPIGKCGQTHFAMSMAEELAKRTEKRVIFLSFESFSSLPQILGCEWNRDITDLMYYADCDGARISLYTEKIKVTRNGVDYILPARTGAQMQDIEYEKVRSLIECLIKEIGYEYVVIDLSEHPQRFLDIASLCHRLFSIIGSGENDDFKMKIFDEILEESGYEELKTRIVKCKLSDYRDKELYENNVKNLIDSEEL